MNLDEKHSQLVIQSEELSEFWKPLFNQQYTQKMSPSELQEAKAIGYEKARNYHDSFTKLYEELKSQQLISSSGNRDYTMADQHKNSSHFGNLFILFLNEELYNPRTQKSAFKKPIWTPMVE